MFEANYDGLVGPTHNYAGLSSGNLASTHHAAATSRPREAALQGLQKMRRLHDLGLKQGVIPPQERPSIETLRALGFQGKEAEVIAAAAKQAPRLLAGCSSASAMWTANAATVAPSRDTADGKVHFTVANLVNKFHRSIEHRQTARTLRALFPHESTFTVHDALPATEWMGDEGAANHTRLARQHGERGLHFFVYGKSVARDEGAPKKFPARQTREASEAVARRHGLSEAQAFFARQHADVIDAGVFHNDVISVGNEDVLFYHENAFADGERAIEDLRARFRAVCGGELRTVRVDAAAVSVADAVKSYLFNSQLVTLPDRSMALIAPADCDRIESVKGYLKTLLADGQQPIRQVITMDLRQSMNNGGGPACLRLRVPLTEAELGHVNKKALFTPALHERLNAWVNKNYRETLTADELADPKLLVESRTALDELTGILGLGSIYPFQR